MISIASRLELFVDNFLIDRMNGTVLKLHQPKPAEIAIKYDKYWEGYPDNPISFYTTVIKDGGIYRIYYRGGYKLQHVNCYAESHDGIVWSKPNLGLVELDGSSSNNVILSTPSIHGSKLYRLSPFIDGSPKASDGERYKASVLGVSSSAEVGCEKKLVGLYGYVSQDGVNWNLLREDMIVPAELKNHFDSQSVMFWSQAEDQYVLYARHMEEGRRSTARSTSKDFINWTSPTLMRYSDTGTTVPAEQMYTNQTHPYFRAPHIYISLQARILFADVSQVSLKDDIDKAVSHFTTDEQRCFYESNVFEQAGALGDLSDGVLLTSRAGSDTYDFTFRESFVRPGIGQGNWTTRTNYPSLGVVQTGPEEMSLYVQRDFGQKSSHLERMTLRLDGFASLNAPYDGGDMTTVPFIFDGDMLVLNYSTSAIGSIRVEIQDINGEIVPGYSLDECRGLIGDEINGIMTWDKGNSVRGLSGTPVRLKFHMKDSDIYSLCFRDIRS